MKRIAAALLCGVMVLASVVPAAAQVVIVSAAASLTDAFNVLKEDFEKEHPGARLVFNFGASGALYRQIEQGAPVDVFASADMRWMDEAVRIGRVEATESKVFARNLIVLAVPKNNPAGVSTLKDLESAGVRRIGVVTPDTSPAGNYARQSLKDLELWEVLEFKYIFAETVTQLLSYLRLGEVDAGFFFASDAVRGADSVAVVMEMPMREPALYPIAPLSDTKQPDLAQAFVRFILSEKGQAVLSGYGFRKAE
ncbi:molybdate ABC transporter substrate-binding protein [Desulfonatronum thiodismutans]|uniref:molybdate ABC transporter substrate-binding protein n=1 Tax=Desulfonatronum thiodismutans TaxID=159290 RepID=UPI0004ABE4C3|nr:molybdate ABC transporter substrate-binding protein [Desulfonatronum thiodismutans]